MGLGFRSMQLFKDRTIATPTITSPAAGTVVYASNAFTLTSSSYVGPHAGDHASTQWEINDNGTLVYATTHNYASTSLSVTLGSTVNAPIYGRVRYLSGAGVTSPWSAYRNFGFEYGTPFSPIEITQVFTVTHVGWSDWFNAHAVWIAPPGDLNLLLGTYMSMQTNLTVTTPGNYTFQYEADDRLTVLVDGAVVANVPAYDGSDVLPQQTTVALTAGTHSIVLTGFNDTAFGTVWSANPGGFALVILDPHGSQFFDLRDLNGATSYYCGGNATYNSGDGLCHLYQRP